MLEGNAFMKKIVSFIGLASILSCARVQTLNMERHTYSERPARVIWVQVPGLTDQQLMLLKLNSKDANDKSAFEKANCLGKMWNFNLFEIQADSKKGLVSQINGSQNIRGTCDDYSQKPVWKYFDEMGYKVATIEQVSTIGESILQAKACGLQEQYLGFNDINLLMSPQKFTEGREFHRLERDWPARGVAFDRACMNGECASTLENNIEDFYQDFSKNNEKTFFLIRTFQLEKAVKSKDLNKVKENLGEIQRIIGSFLKKMKSDTLLVVSGAGGINMEFPQGNSEWMEFEKKGKYLSFKSIDVLSPVFSYGAMAENFCGVYRESELLKRALFIPPRKELNWDYLLPF